MRPARAIKHARDLRHARAWRLARLGRAAERAVPPGAGEAAPRVVVGSLRGWGWHLAFESAIAHGLRLRGAEVSFLICGGGQPRCELGAARSSYPQPCDLCAALAQRATGAARMPVTRLGDHLPWGVVAPTAPTAPPATALNGSALREGARRSAVLTLRVSDPLDSSEGALALDEFTISAAGSEQAAQTILGAQRPDVLFMLSGLPAAETGLRIAAERAGVRVCTYEVSHRPGTVKLSNGAPAAVAASPPGEELPPLSSAAERALDRMLENRARGISHTGLDPAEEYRPHESYYSALIAEEQEIRAFLDVAPDARIVGLFPSIGWDTAVQQGRAPFSMEDWLATAVSAAGMRPELIFVLRAHPAEQLHRTPRPAISYLPADLPANVRVVDHDDPVDSYALAGMSELVLTYASTIGLEAATAGRPVASAGHPHYAGRGFTFDVRTLTELRDLLSRPTWENDDRARERARRYAFEFFLRRMIPLPNVLASEAGRVKVPDLDELRPGHDARFDFVCDRILHGGDFALPEALALASSTGLVRP